MHSKINPTLRLLLLSLGAALTTALLLLSGQHLRAQLQSDDEPAPALQPDDSHHHDPVGKPGAAVQLIGPSVTTMELHEQRELHLILALEPSQTLLVTVQPEDGLVLVSSQSEWSFTSTSGDVELPLSIYAATAGNHFVHVFVTTEDANGRRAARAMAMQVRVGADAVMQMQYKQAAQPPAAPAFVSLPATETVR